MCSRGSQATYRWEKLKSLHLEPSQDHLKVRSIKNEVNPLKKELQKEEPAQTGRIAKEE